MYKRKYDYIISLGEKCFVAQSLNKLKLRVFSSPFDWVDCCVEGAGLKKRLQIILDNFQNFFDKDLIEPAYIAGTTRFFINKATKLAFRHEFEQDDDFDTKYPEIKEKYDRRITRFNNILASGKRILLVYAASLFENSDIEDTIDKLKQIQYKFCNSNIDILIVDSNKKLNRKNNIKYKRITKNIVYVFGCDLYKPVSDKAPGYYIKTVSKILN